MDEPMAVQGVCLGLLMLSAHFFGRLALKLRLGQMIGQLLGGVVVGPYFLDAVGLLDKLHLGGYHEAFESFHFLIFTFLGVIAFALGEELHWERLKKIGLKAGLISAFQAGVTWVFLTTTFVLAGFEWPLALVIGSIGVATAPAITFVLLNTLEIEGRFRNMVANILVLDDVLEVILFSIFAQAAAKIYHGQAVDPREIAGHLVNEFGAALLIGLAVFVFLRVAVRRRPMREPHVSAATLGPGFVTRLLTAHPTPSVEVLVIVIGSVAVACGLGLGFHLPFLITGIFAGVLIANLHTHALFESLKIDNVMPLLNLVFFAMIGANIRFDVFGGGHLWLVLAYVAARGVGKLLGTYVGCKLTGQDPKVTSCLPLLMLPQAGVAAVEAVYVVTLIGEQARIVTDVVLPALVIFEVCGVFLSERTLLRWRAWTVGESEVLSKRDRVLREAFAPKREQLSALAEFVPEGLAGVSTKATAMRHVVRELAAKLKAIDCTADDEVVVERSLAREKMGATAIGCGVVLPHCKILGQQRTVCAIALLDRPLDDAEGPDGVPIDTVILLVSPVERPDEHLRALSSIAQVFSDEGDREMLKAAMRHGRIEEVLRPAP